MTQLEPDFPVNNEINYSDEIDIQEAWRIIRSYRKSIIVIFFLILVTTIYVTLTTQPVYQATTVIMIKESGSNAGSLVFDFGLTGSNQRLQNEIEVLKSHYLHDKVVQSLIDDGSAEELALFGTRYIRNRYRLKDYLMGWFGKVKDSSKHPDHLDSGQRIGVVEAFRNASSISSVKDTDVLKIGVTSSDSSDAVFLSNRIATIYRNLDLAGGQGELHFVLAFLETQITKYETRLAVVENELKQFQSEFQIYSLDGSAQLLLDDLTHYEGVYYTNTAELKVAQERVNYLKGQLSNSENALMDEITNTNNPMIVALRGKIAELEAQKVQQMVDEGWDELSLQARDFNRRIDEMKSKLTTITESMILSGWSEEDPFAASQELFNKIVEQQVEVEAARTRAEPIRIVRS